MFINEHGSRNDPTIILLAPMMISGSDLYGQMHPFFMDPIISFLRIREAMERPELIAQRMRNMRI